MQTYCKKIICILAATSIVLWGGCGYQEPTEELELQEYEDGADTEDAGTKNSKEDEAREVIVVHVCGCVNQPGVYELPEGSRLYEAVKAAGGTAEDAAVDYLNQAAVVEDGQQIYIPTVSEVSDGEYISSSAPSTDDGKIDLNTADAQELMSLPGIGEAKAAAILQYREEKGGFQTIEELMEVSGIKEGVFEKIKDQIKV